ncbi:type II toxin-antitoxin system RelE/ParE family toxin [Sphingomonas immobilis]|uniref:Type II toxin-antitoxin system RelE/ParE family toxin n=1 Tax=Sphingomonas immobilis TaxID=3063997 RepID=A0ABT9A5I9_9SPHN|nr:type II toxin-antitoxin system RelE/ParE family toxin [Sphingomonas sp. CA1-15]MDO7844697.1 type II toxin-antitoxin system RelE/ParE family toxin [Sphingomonas sp. CA1-15]
MRKLRLSAVASADLRDIRQHSKTIFGAKVALDYMNGFRSVFGLLRERPLAGTVEEGLGQEVRKFSYRSHAVYYRFEDDVIDVIRILHHAQNARAQIGARQ